MNKLNKESKIFMNESEAIKEQNRWLMILGFSIIVFFISGFSIGYEAHSVSLFEVVDASFNNDINKSPNHCWERAFILSAWLPFELTEDLQIKDCQEIKWLDEKFQKLYFKNRFTK